MDFISLKIYTHGVNVYMNAFYDLARDGAKNAQVYNIVLCKCWIFSYILRMSELSVITE